MTITRAQMIEFVSNQLKLSVIATNDERTNMLSAIKAALTEDEARTLPEDRGDWKLLSVYKTEEGWRARIGWFGEFTVTSIVHDGEDSTPRAAVMNAMEKIR